MAEFSKTLAPVNPQASTSAPSLSTNTGSLAGDVLAGVDFLLKTKMNLDARDQQQAALDLKQKQAEDQRSGAILAQQHLARLNQLEKGGKFNILNRKQDTEAAKSLSPEAYAEYVRVKKGSGVKTSFQINQERELEEQKLRQERVEQGYQIAMSGVLLEDGETVDPSEFTPEQLEGYYQAFQARKKIAELHAAEELATSRALGVKESKNLSAFKLMEHEFLVGAQQSLQPTMDLMLNALSAGDFASMQKYQNKLKRQSQRVLSDFNQTIRGLDKKALIGVDTSSALGRVKQAVDNMTAYATAVDAAKASSDWLKVTGNSMASGWLLKGTEAQIATGLSLSFGLNPDREVGTLAIAEQMQGGVNPVQELNQKMVDAVAGKIDPEDPVVPSVLFTSTADMNAKVDAAVNLLRAQRSNPVAANNPKVAKPTHKLLSQVAKSPEATERFAQGLRDKGLTAQDLADQHAEFIDMTLYPSLRDYINNVKFEVQGKKIVGVSEVESTLPEITRNLRNPRKSDPKMESTKRVREAAKELTEKASIAAAFSGEDPEFFLKLYATQLNERLLGRVGEVESGKEN